MLRRASVAAFVVALAASACGGTDPGPTQPRERTPLTTTLAPEVLATSTTAAPVAVPGGFLLYKGDGFEMFLPKTFTIAGAGDVDLEEVLREIGNSELEGIIEETFRQGGKLIAFDFGNATPEFVPNVNILKLPLPPLRGEQLAGAIEKDLERIGATTSEVTLELLPAGEAVRARYVLPLDLSGGEGVSYTVLTPANQWVITYSANNMRQYVDRFEIMMESFAER